MTTYTRAIKQYAEKLEKAASWHNSRRVVGRFIKGKEDHYIYEFYCYLRILSDLKENHKIKFVIGAIHKNDFPAAPANKAGWPYFTLHDSSDRMLYQVCSGTEIEGCAGETESPDISFQAPDSSNNPTYKDVSVIMDAKHITSSAKVPKGSYDGFAMMVINLKLLDKKLPSNIIFNELKEIDKNCIISNVESYKKNSAYLQSHNICALQNFDVEGPFEVVR